jgi:hypothetical protein
MGVTRKILAAADLARDPAFYTDSLRIDFAENFHLHFKNTRLVFSPREFARVAWRMFQAYWKWRLRGSPPHVHPDHMMMFSSERLAPASDDDRARSRADELAVEIQMQADYVHLHYRWLRIEFTIDEFIQFAATMERARLVADALPWVLACPRRIGLHHGSNPRHRVAAGGSGHGFWLDHERLETAVSRLWDAETGAFIDQIPCQNEIRPQKKSLFSECLRSLIPSWNKLFRTY